MPQQHTLVAVLERGRGLVAKHLADFSDNDMLARPVPTANHAAYQLAHLLRTSIGIVRAVTPGANVMLPPKVEGDAKAPPASDDPAAFPTKFELIAAYEAVVDAILAGVRATNDADFDAPSPEHFRGFAPTLATLVLMLPLHTSMHVGQIQVIRRALGKPVLF